MNLTMNLTNEFDSVNNKNAELVELKVRLEIFKLLNLKLNIFEV